MVKKLQCTSKTKFAPKKVHVYCYPLIHYSFLNPGETITSEKYEQQVEKHQKLQCLKLALVNIMSPVLLHNNWSDVLQPMLPKLNKLCYKVFHHPPYSPDLSPTEYHFVKHLDNFLQVKSFHNQQEAEHDFQEFVKSWSMDLYATGINKHISHWQKMCWFVIVPISINKDVFQHQFSSVTQSCLTLCDPMDCSTPTFPVHYQLQELAQTHVHQVSDAIQPFNPLVSPSVPAFNLSQHHGLFQWFSSSHQVTKVLEFQLQHQSFQWIFRTDFL